MPYIFINWIETNKLLSACVSGVHSLKIQSLVCVCVRARACVCGKEVIFMSLILRAMFSVVFHCKCGLCEHSVVNAGNTVSSLPFRILGNGVRSLPSDFFKWLWLTYNKIRIWKSTSDLQFTASLNLCDFCTEEGYVPTSYRKQMTRNI